MNSTDRIALSPHFILYNFTRNGNTIDHNIKNTPNSKQRLALENLCIYLLEPLWQHFGPLAIAQGFMSRQVAYWTGVEPNSDYCHGMAADIVCYDRNKAHFMYQFIKKNLEFNEMRFLPDAKNPRWLHVSYNHENNKNTAYGNVIV